MLDTRSTCQPGDEIVIPIDEHGRCRRVIVECIEPYGIGVIWFQPNGVGPHRMLLPHVGLCPVLYAPEAAGRHKNHFSKTDQEIVDDHKAVAKEIKQ